MASSQYEPDPDDERTLWAAATDDVTPLPTDPRARVRAVPRVPSPRAVEPYRTPPARSRDTDLDETEDDAGWVAAGIDRRELRKLRRGQYIAARRIDLHGLTKAAATAAARRFVESARGAFRCVAIVHGRGLHSTGKAVIKSEVRALLRSHPSVLAYSDAPRDDGGSGAVYVLLRGAPLR